jgi:7-cyano-7-deazaguanine synthase
MNVKEVDEMLNIKENKCVTLVSGGLDSVTMLYFLKSRGFDQKALSFNYGQRHSKELEFAKYHTEKLNVPHSVVDLTSLSEAFKGSALTEESIEIPEGDYTDDSQKVTVVPNRNMVFLSIGIALAESEKRGSVMYASHLNDTAVYPDCRPEFVRTLDEASQLGTYKHVRTIAPFGKLSKNEIAVLAFSFDVGFEKTWSCYKGGEKPCGKCGSCMERAEAISYIRHLLEVGKFSEMVTRIDRKVDSTLEEMLI